MGNIKELLRKAESNGYYLLMNKDRSVYKSRFTGDGSVQTVV